MGLSYTLVSKEKKKVEGKWVYPIYLKYSFGGKQKLISTSQFVEKKYWDNGTLSNRIPNYSIIQKQLLNKRNSIDEIVKGLEETNQIPTTTKVIEILHSTKAIEVKKEPKQKSFWVCYREFLIDKEDMHRGYTKTLYTLKLKLEDFQNNHKGLIMNFDYILDGTFDSDFLKYCLRTEIKEKDAIKYVGLSNNYINKIFSNLSIFLNWCKDRKYISDVKKFKPQRTVKNDVLVYLNSKEVKKLFDYSKFDYPITYDNFVVIKDIDKKGNPIYRNNLELVKDIFTFQCAVGCRWGDIHSMKVGMFTIQTDYFIWMMEKTKSVVKVPRNPISDKIFRKYSKGKSLEQFLFPKYSQQNFNSHLKEIGKILNFNRLVKREIMVGGKIREESKKDKHLWEFLSSHCGRRSFIKNLIDLQTMDNWSIMKLSGHTTLSSFQKYVSVTDNDIEKGGKLYSKEFTKQPKEEVFRQLDNLPMDMVLDYIKKNMGK